MPRFRPMGLGDMFDEAFDLYKKNFLFLLLVAALVAAPMYVLTPLLAHWFPNEPSLSTLIVNALGGMVTIQALNQFGPVISGPAIFAPLHPLTGAIEIAALVGACSACYLGENPALWSVYRAPLRRIVTLILTMLLYGLFMLLGMIFCYIGIVVPMTLLALIGQVFVLENLSFGKALRRSSRLVSGFGGRVFGCLALISLVSYIVGLGIQLPLMYGLDVALNVSPTSGSAFSGMGAPTALDHQRMIVADVSDSLAQLILTPFTFCVLTVLYYDLRIRKEAFDITLLAWGLHYPPLAQLSGYLPPVTPLPPVAAAPRPQKPLAGGKP